MQVLRRLSLLAASALASALVAAHADPLEAGFRSPPPEARPHTYWLWLNGHLDVPSGLAELRDMKAAGLGGILLFEMGARGDPKTSPPPGPGFLTPAWLEKLKLAVDEAKRLGLQVDMSVISSWDMGGPWIEPRLASMALYATETMVRGGSAVDTVLPFPTPERAAPLGPDGRPVFWTDVAVLAVRSPRRLPGHEFVLRLDPPVAQEITAVVLDPGQPNAPAPLAATMTPVRDFAVDVSTDDAHSPTFTEVLRGTLDATKPAQRFPLPAGTRARHVRLRLLSGHDAARDRWTLGEFEVHDTTGRNVAASHRVDQRRSGGLLAKTPVALTNTDWSASRIHDGGRTGPGGVFATAGRPPFDIADPREIVDVTARVDRDGRLRWDAPAGEWAILRYVCMNTGEKLKVPSPSSDGLATDHLNPEATRVHMNHVIAQLRAGLGADLSKSGVTNLYLASYEVVGRVWSPVFAGEFKRRRGYALEPWLPAVLGARIQDADTTERFLYDYRKTLGEVVVDAYYRTSAEVARAAGLAIKSEAGGPGPPIHTPPVEALSAYGAIDNIQGEFWPFWPNNDAINVIKEPASAGHLYGKRRIHLEAFTSFHHWAEGPQDLKPSADRVFTEGGNHFVWHTWTHQSPESGVPGWVYGAGTHLNRNITWWSKAPPFLSYLARGSFLLQRGTFVADVLYYKGDDGGTFVPPRRNPASLGPGYDYDVTNAEALQRLRVTNGRITTPEGISYAMLVLPKRSDINPAALARIEELVTSGATLVGPRPTRASGLEGQPQSDARVHALAAKLWADLDGRTRTTRRHGAGRVFLGVPERAVLAELNIPPDFTAPPDFDFTHRRDGDTEIYFVRNREAAPAQGRAQFRARAARVELWDPMTGEIRPAAGIQTTDTFTEVPLALAAHGSTFVIFRDGSGSASPPAGNSVAPHSAPVALDAGPWKVEFSSPAGAPEPLRLDRVEPWTAESAPGYRFFSGHASYRRTVTLPAGWRDGAPRVELELGRLWAIGEVWVNGKSLGVVWAPPFAVDCTSALRDGENEIVVEVTGAWHNRIVGEARGLLPKWTRTNIAVSQRKPWKDLEPIESGLFGPVRLVPRGAP